MGCGEWILGGKGARERERELGVSGKGGDGKLARGRGGMVRFFWGGKSGDGGGRGKRGFLNR